MSNRIRRSFSYTNGVGRPGNFPSGGSKTATAPPGVHGGGTYGTHRRRLVLCDCCGQSHELGKNHLYDYPEEVDDDLMCQICLQPLVEPLDTPCDHTYCYNCILGHVRRSPSCPADRQPVCERDLRQSNLLVRKILDKLKVVCPNTAYCDATMPRVSLERHLKTTCPGTYVRCPREKRGCSYMGPRCQLDEHLWSCCYGEDCNFKTGKKLPIKEGSLCIVEIPKGTEDLGLSVSQCERTGVLIIDEVCVGGNAYRDGRLMPGDEIQEIDSFNFTNKSLAQARLALSTINPLVRLSILRLPHQQYNSEDIEELQLIKDEFRPLGIQIHTYKTQPGIYIYHLVPNSPAEEYGHLQVGDRLLEVNYVDVRTASVDEAAKLMAKASGVIQLLVAHRHRLSPTGSDISTKSCMSAARSAHSSADSYTYHHRQHSYQLQHNSSLLPQRSHSLRKERVYEEILLPSGYRIGGGKCIIIKKKPDEVLGVGVSGGVVNLGGDDLPIFVSSIRPNSSIERSCKVQRGDIIISINAIQMTNKTLSEAVQIIKSLTSAAVVKLELIQGDEMYEDEGGLSPDWCQWMETYMKQRKSPLEYSITLSREGNGSLGFSLVGGLGSPKGDSPIYVKSIAPKGIVAKDGRLQCRDQITRINGIPVTYKTQGEVVDLIRTSSGQITIAFIPHDFR